MPFVQGHLRKEFVAVTISTACVHCARPMRIEVDSRLQYHVGDVTGPLIFVPLVDFEKLKAPSIIDDF